MPQSGENLLRRGILPLIPPRLARKIRPSAPPGRNRIERLSGERLLGKLWPQPRIAARLCLGSFVNPAHVLIRAKDRFGWHFPPASWVSNKKAHARLRAPTAKLAPPEGLRVGAAPKRAVLAMRGIA